VSGLFGVHEYCVWPDTDVTAPSVVGVIEKAALTASMLTDLEKLRRKLPSVGTSF